MLDISRVPVLILSTPRSGSTALGALVKKQLEHMGDIPYIREPDFTGYSDPQANNRTLNDFYELYGRTGNFILKCHYFRFINFYRKDIRERLTAEAFKIRLRRRSIVYQVASLYVAKRMNNKFHYTNSDRNDIAFTLPIDHEELRIHIKDFKYANQLIDDAKLDFDLDLYYEDLTDLDSTGFIETAKPENYDELCDHITKLL